jgi:hypothetical protein
MHLTISSVYPVFLGSQIKEEERDGTCDMVGGNNVKIMVGIMKGKEETT